MGTGKMIKHTVSDSIPIPMELSMRGTGWMINSMVKEKSIGQMAHSMRVNISTEKKTVMANSFGPIDLAIVASSLTIIFMERVLTLGQTAEFTMVTGNKIKCTAKVYSLGPMVESMKANIMTIKNRDTESSTGLTADNMTDTGCPVSKKVLVSISMQRVRCATADGKTENVSNGYRKKSIMWKYNNFRSRKTSFDPSNDNLKFVDY